MIISSRFVLHSQISFTNSTPSSVSSTVPVQSVEPTLVTVTSQMQTTASSSTSSSASTSTSASATVSTSTQRFLASLSSHYRSTTSTDIVPTSPAPRSTVPVQAVTMAKPSPTTTSQQPQRPITTAPANNPPPSSGGGTSDGDIQAYLSAHNSVRAQHGAAALSWSDDLASKAQQWANGCKFQHSGGSLGPFGGLCFLFYLVTSNLFGVQNRKFGRWNWISI